MPEIILRDIPSDSQAHKKVSEAFQSGSIRVHHDAPDGGEDGYLTSEAKGGAGPALSDKGISRSSGDVVLTISEGDLTGGEEVSSKIGNSVLHLAHASVPAGQGVPHAGQ
jgi:hypothetical protein